MAEDKKIVSLDDDSYARRVEEAKKQRVPLGGAPMPKIPAFDSATPDRSQGVQGMGTHTMLTPEQMEERQRAGAFIPGVGAAYVANQPPMPGEEPRKAEAAPGQKFANPPRPEGSGLRTETAEQLAALVQANVTENDKAKKDEDKAEEARKVVDDIDEEFDYDEFGNRVHNMLANKQRKDAIEGRCKEMNFEDLIAHQELRQRVLIIPGKFEPTFRTTSGNEDLAIKRLMLGDHPNNQYVLTRFALMSLCAGLYAINGTALPAHLDKDNQFDEKEFDKKFKYLLRFPLPLLADLGVNYRWFDNRVRKLLIIDQIKGF